jgi:hypothetical protein
MEGVSKKSIRERIGLPRNSLKKYIRLFLASVRTPEEIDELKDTDLEQLFLNMVPHSAIAPMTTKTTSLCLYTKSFVVRTITDKSPPGTAVEKSIPRISLTLNDNTMYEQTLQEMRQMKCYGMMRAFCSSLENDAMTMLTPDELVSMLVESEWDDHNNLRIDMQIRNARFRYKANVEHLYYDLDRNQDKNHI